ncbi:MAG TPA: preprotein translocase subunit YajC, partial [Candidatus Eisenbacteria bacterium]|nr:preprotein translocase subunit YajC [Candidatus Eisenbacteria bacterium]
SSVIDMPLSFVLQNVGGGLGGMVLFLPLVLLIFYMFYSQQRRQKKWQGMLDQLKTGDKVTTSGGLRGTIMALKDDSLHLRVPPNNLVVEVTKASVTHVSTTEEEPKK